MPRETREEERLTEDESARRKLGPRGVPGGQDTAKMTPQQDKEYSLDRRLRRPYHLIEQNFCWSPATNPTPALNQAPARHHTFGNP